MLQPLKNEGTRYMVYGVHSMSFSGTYRYKTDFKRFDEVKLLSEGVKTSVIDYKGALYNVPTTALAMEKPKESPVINKSLIPGDSVTQIQFAITKSNRPLWFTRTTGNRFEWKDYFIDYSETETALTVKTKAEDYMLEKPITEGSKVITKFFESDKTIRKQEEGFVRAIYDT